MLKDYLANGHQVLAPGVFDGLSARIAQQSGFEVLYISGFCVSGTLLGKPGHTKKMWPYGKQTSCANR